MDIFKYAEEFDADYYDPIKCIIYKVKKYNKCKKFGIPVQRIEMTDLEGNSLGYISKQ